MNKKISISMGTFDTKAFYGVIRANFQYFALMKSDDDGYCTKLTEVSINEEDFYRLREELDWIAEDGSVNRAFIVNHRWE